MLPIIYQKYRPHPCLEILITAKRVFLPRRTRRSLRFFASFAVKKNLLAVKLKKHVVYSGAVMRRALTVAGSMIEGTNK